MLCKLFGAVMKRPAGVCRRFIDQGLNCRQELRAVRAELRAMVVDAEMLCTVRPFQELARVSAIDLLLLYHVSGTSCLSTYVTLYVLAWSSAYC